MINGVLLAICSIAVSGSPLASASDHPETRKILSLNGVWRVEQGDKDSVPSHFSREIVVPGLLTMAAPAFSEVGAVSKQRNAFWYCRKFTCDGPMPAVALLKIHKAMWGTKVFLNGRVVGEHLPCFTPTVLDVRPYLRDNGRENELVIRVGANRESLPEGVPSGWDFEKYLFIPGIYDSVELILTGAPHIVNVQTAPDVPAKSVRVVAEIQGGDKACETTVNVAVSEAKSGKEVATAGGKTVRLEARQLQKVEVTIPLPSGRLWSPEDPFLYVAKVSTNADVVYARFGMRSFGCDPKTRLMMLNGKPYYMRGTNVTIHRFFEDSQCGDLPWRADWVRKLHQKYKTMHWNSIRYCIGFPPDFWYDIADEEGFLIQDEFPIWLGGNKEKPPERPRADEIAAQYIEWMRERWNHPCVVIWDAQNESYSPELGKAIASVRQLDLSNRPWENGYEGAPCLTDCVESHPYLFDRDWENADKRGFRLQDLATTGHTPRLTEKQQTNSVPIIINEYDWLWLNRDGKPTSLTNAVYARLLGPNTTVAERRRLHARYVAALTEFWRSHRQAAGVLHFCGLGYSRDGSKPWPEGGATCDDFVDVRNLVFEPLFEQYVRDAFAPVALMIDAWQDAYSPGKHEIPIIVINDLYETRQGTIRLRLLQNGRIVSENVVAVEVKPLGNVKKTVGISIPDTPADYQLEATLLAPSAPPVRSVRDFKVSG